MMENMISNGGGLNSFDENDSVWIDPLRKPIVWVDHPCCGDRTPAGWLCKCAARAEDLRQLRDDQS